MRYVCGWYDTVCRAVKSSGFTHLIGAAGEGNGHRRPGKKPAKGIGPRAKGPGVPAKGIGPPAKGRGVPANGDEAGPMAWKGGKIWKNKNEDMEECK